MAIPRYILRATLSVNHVTSTGDGTDPGRLYYRKLPGNTLGSIYFAHETKDGDEEYIEIIGSRSSSQSNPSDGIALNKVFSYEIKAEDDDYDKSTFYSLETSHD